MNFFLFEKKGFLTLFQDDDIKDTKKYVEKNLKNADLSKLKE